MSIELNIADRIKNLGGQIAYLVRALTLIWKAAPGLTLLWSGLLLVQGLLPVGIVYLTRSLVDSLVAALDTGGSLIVFRPTLVYLIAMAFLMLLSEGLRGFTSYIRLKQSELVGDHITGLIHEQSTRVDLSFYDSPEFFNRLHRARREASYRPVMLLENFGSLFQNGITLFAMAAVLTAYGIWLPLALVVSTLPALYVVLRNRIMHYTWRREATAQERRTWYFDWLLTSRDAAAEVGLFRLGEHFRLAYTSVRRRLREQHLSLARKEGISEGAAFLVSFAVTAAAMVWMVWKAVKGHVTLGDLALFYQAFNQGQRLMRSILAEVGEIYSNSLFLGDLFEYLSLTPRVVDAVAPVEPPPAPKREIAFRRVTFSYPGRDAPVLNDFSFVLPAGRISAVVGANGSGKSTLVKLLTRLYDPQVGFIEVDGRDVKSFTIEDLRRLYTVMFQEPVRYNFSAAKNISLGDLATTPGVDRIRKAAEAAGAAETIQRLPGGYESTLGRWFAQGTELSGGEWKRISLARALVRPAPIILLDEPTSEMDPWAAIEWVKKVREHVDGRTALIVTHRMATARCADIINVMEDGAITESGSHEELLAAGGRYSSLWQEEDASS